MPRDESWREPLEAREGLVTLGVLTQDEAMRAVFDSLPRITEARLLADRVIAGLGERAHHDVMAGPGNRLIFLRDAEDPRLILPEAFLALDLNVAPPPPIQFPAFELPESMKPKEPEEPPEAPDELPVLPGPDRYPGKLRIAEGAASIELEYGPNGVRTRTCSSSGDLYTWGHHHHDRPYTLDPMAKPPQTPPLGLLCRADLDPDGHDLGTLAGMVLELKPEAMLPGRVYLPVEQPGGIGGCWWRGYTALRTALWDGRIGEDEHGWVALDAWTGTVLVVAPTRAEAFARWQEAVAGAVPLPPREPPPPPEPDTPDLPPEVEVDEEKKTVHISTGTFTIAIMPRVLVPWPEARAEHVPAVVLPLPAASPIPAGWEGYGFTRRVRLVGEHGHVCTAFVADERAGFTLVGEGAVAALDPATLDQELDRIDVERREEIEGRGAWLRGNPYLNQEYPWTVASYRVWDELGRTARLKDGGIAWTESCAARGMDGDGLRWMVTRASRRDVLEDREGANSG